jgi:hypothetical protein
VNHMELSPNYAGTLIAMTSTIANAIGILSPFFTGYVTNNNVIKMNKKKQNITPRLVLLFP